jgi:hypothetical protein
MIFLHDQVFRENIYSKLADPYFQLSLRSSVKITTLNIPNASVNLFYHDSLEPFLHHREKIMLTYEPDGSSPFAFSISNSVSVLHLDNFIHVKELTAKTQGFPHQLQSLKLFRFLNLTDISCLSPLKGLYKLELYFCLTLVDVSGLGQVHDLTLFKCPQIRDISALTNNYHLKIEDCFSIQLSCLSVLGNGVHLETNLIQSLEKLADCCSKETRLLYLFRGSLALQELSVSVFQNLYSISLKNIYQFTTVAPIAGVPVVYLDQCTDLEDISTFHEDHNISVILACCPKIVDFHSLQKIRKVTIHACPGFTNGFQVAEVKVLSLEFCQNISDISMLGQVESLSLSNCHQITSLQGLHTVESLTVNDCMALNDLTTLLNDEGGQEQQDCSALRNELLILGQEYSQMIPEYIQGEYHSPQRRADQQSVVLLRKPESERKKPNSSNCLIT